MEAAKYIIIILLIVHAGTVTSGNQYKADIYNAYITNNMNRWKEIIDTMELAKVNSEDFLTELVNYQYGYVAWCIGNEQSSSARQYLSLAEKNLELLSKHASASIVNAYRSAFYGFKIGLNKLRAPVYGPRSIRFARLAIEEDEMNPMGYIQYANAQFYMPPIFGGSKTEAIIYYKKAQELMEQKESQIENDWNYLNLLTVIAQAYESTGQYNQALQYYEKILMTEPGFEWVKDELYPKLKEKL